MSNKITTIEGLVNTYKIQRIINAVKDGKHYDYTGFFLLERGNIVLCNKDYADANDAHFFSNEEVLEYLKDFI